MTGVQTCALPISVNSLNLGGLEFRDILKLLGQSTSLDKFARMCELKTIHKGIFPFDKLTSLEYLSEPSLPPSAEDWQSRISNKKITQDQVDEALRLFEQHGFSNVGDYLIHYLEKDVILLLEALFKFWKMMNHMADINFITYGSLTAASVSIQSSLHYLMEHRRINMFSVADGQLYAVSMCYRIYDGVSL